MHNKFLNYTNEELIIEAVWVGSDLLLEMAERLRVFLAKPSVEQSYDDGYSQGYDDGFTDGRG